MVEADGIVYLISNGKAIAISADSAISSAIIPEMINGCPVTELRETFNNNLELKPLFFQKR